MNQSVTQSNIDWAAFIKAKQDSKQFAKAYCANHSLNYDQFGYYKRKISGVTNRAPKKRKPSGITVVDVESRQATAALSLVLPSEVIEDSNFTACPGLLGRLS